MNGTLPGTMLLLGAYSFLILAIPALWTTPARGDDGPRRGVVTKNGVDLDIRSLGRTIADELATSGGQVSADPVSPAPGESVVPQIHLRGGNVQTNDSALDNIQTFPGFRPFVNFTQSETSIAAFGRNIVATYNTSANQTLVLTGGILTRTSFFISGFSTSTDGGQTWTSGFMPPVPGSSFTFGDPVVAVDRDGTFHFAGLGADPASQSTIQVNRSLDGGRTWSEAVVVQQDDGSDKEWLAVGADPLLPSRDNIYVTWTSFQTDRSELRFGRSTDGGLTWNTKTIFAPGPDPNPANPQSFVQFSNTTVDRITSRLYVPFLQFSNADPDYIRILVSDDGGETFSFLNFNVAGAPAPSVLPVVSSGELIDCGTDGGTRLVIHAGADQGGGQFGLRRFRNASRLVTQPAFAARNGILYLAWSNSTSPTFGDRNGQSNVLFMRSDDGGATWTAPIQVNPGVASDLHHVLPSLAIDRDPTDVHITYYTQHADGTVDLDMANSHDRGKTFRSARAVRITTSSFALPPSNSVISGPLTTNYDRSIRPCYALGEYQGLTSANGTIYAAWGDAGNVITQPVDPLDPISGQIHSQTDVFFQKVKAQ